jgi:hypothetical protein
MITEDYVSFETAKLLKEKGFDADIDLWYDKDGVKFFTNKYEISSDWRVRQNQNVYLCPTLQMTMKWLRENHNLHIIVTPEYGDVEYMPGEWQEEFLGWKYTIISVNGTTTTVHPTVYAKTAESAYEAGIEYCIKYAI